MDSEAGAARCHPICPTGKYGGFACAPPPTPLTPQPTLQPAPQPTPPAPVHPAGSKSELIAQLKTMIENLTAVDPATHMALTAKINAAVAAPCDSSGGADDSGATEKLSCTRTDYSRLDVSFFPFENAFAPDFPVQLAAAKAKGNRMCFCA